MCGCLAYIVPSHISLAAWVIHTIVHCEYAIRRLCYVIGILYAYLSSVTLVELVTSIVRRHFYVKVEWVNFGFMNSDRQHFLHNTAKSNNQL